MDVGKILHELTYAEGLPKQALKAASAQRAEMVPLFVQEIENFLALDPSAQAKSTPLFFIFHLLGEWLRRSVYGNSGEPCLSKLPPASLIASVGRSREFVTECN
jgi:hypothetical protein